MVCRQSQARHVEKEMRGPRSHCQTRQVFRNVRRVNSEASPIELAIVPHYRARPLDGVRATAPCLHNGSVPTLQDMLTPQDERPKKFCVEAPQPRILADDW